VSFIRRAELEIHSGYPFDIPAVRDLRRLSLDHGIIVFTGENGTGKSTIIEGLAVAAGLNPEGGSKHFSFETRPSHSKLGRAISLVRNPRRESTAWFLRAESYFTAASYLEDLSGSALGPYGGRSLHEMSRGESVLALLQNRFGPRGLYFLDEPEAGLSGIAQLAAVRRISELLTSDCQFIVATHSPIIAAIPDAVLFELSSSGIQRREWEELSMVTLYRDFFSSPRRFLAGLD